MSTSAARTPSLINFFVFNSTFGPKEGEEHKKILYYHPDTTDIDTRIRNVGLCEAVAKFTSTFNPDQPCESLHTQKTRQLFLQPEPNFWMVMTVSIPWQQKSKEGQVYIEYYADEVQDRVYSSILKTSYRMFKLFMGTFENVLKQTNNNVDLLRDQLASFYGQYIPTIRLSHADILDVFGGIHFLPLKQYAFMKIQCFINHLEFSNPQVQHTVFLYNEQLVWSGIEQSDMQILYKYLTVSLSSSAQAEGQNNAFPNQSGLGYRQGRFVKISINPATKTVSEIPKVFVSSESQMKDFYLLIYRLQNITLCLLIDANTEITVDFLTRLDAFMEPQLSVLSSEINDQLVNLNISTSSSSEPQFRYIYFNHMNLAQKSTIHMDYKRGSNVLVSPDILKLLADINLDLSKLEKSGEIIVKTTSECWVIGKLSNQREVYVVINQKNANLIEINEEVKRLCASQFCDIFFIE